MSHSAIGLNFHSPPSPPGKAYTTSPVILAFMLGILICLIVGFCFIYFCRCFFINCIYARAFRRPTVNNLLRQIHSPNRAAVASPIPGIDPALLQIFPTFHYASVKEFQRKNNNNKSYSLECAICLFEFEEDSFLRLLTVCCHVFHQECIDLWLESHKTCPVCRTDLDSSSKEKHQDQNQSITTENNPNNNNNNNETRIDVGEEEEEQVSRRREEEEEGEEGVSGEGDQEKRFSKSHSTGHSIVVIKGQEEEDDDDDDDKKENKEDKYTLRLPEHVRMKLIRGHNNHTSKSCESFTEMARLCSKCCYVEAVSSSSSGCCATTTTSSCEPLRI